MNQANTIVASVERTTSLLVTAGLHHWNRLLALVFGEPRRPIPIPVSSDPRRR